MPSVWKRLRIAFFGDPNQAFFDRRPSMSVGQRFKRWFFGGYTESIFDPDYEPPVARHSSQAPLVRYLQGREAQASRAAPPAVVFSDADYVVMGMNQIDSHIWSVRYGRRGSAPIGSFSVSRGTRSTNIGKVKVQVFF